MKKINILIVLIVGILALLIGSAQSVSADSWDYRNAPERFQILFVGVNETAHLNAAISKFNGLLQSYSVSHDQNVEKQIFAAANDLSSSLEFLNAKVQEIYPDLNEEEQIVVRDAYSSLASYLETLVVEANSVLGREVFRIYKVNPSDKILDFIDAISF